MLVSIEDIKKYLKNVPPVPESVRKTLDYLKEGKLKEAAVEAEKDLVLKKQIESIVNSAYFSLATLWQSQYQVCPHQK